MMHAGETVAGPEGGGAMSLIAALLEQRTGQQIAANRAWRIETALKPILRAHGLNTLDELVARLMIARDGQLAETVVDALLNQETSFFRDVAVMDALIEAAVLFHGENAGGRRLRVWSAACSTGQEPLSLAMLFDERAASGIPTPEIVATDVSPSAITRARAGKYSQFEVQRGLPVRRLMTWFDGNESEWTVKSELVRRIHFRQQNLVEDVAPAGKFDIILCRNVLLYLSTDLRRRVFASLATALRPGGLLVLGAGETVIGQTELFTPSERFRGFYHLAG